METHCEKHFAWRALPLRSQRQKTAGASGRQSATPALVRATASSCIIMVGAVITPGMKAPIGPARSEFSRTP